MRFDLGELQAAFETRLARLDADRFAERLAGKDPTLWSGDPAHPQVAARRLGWLESPALMRHEAAALRSFAAEVATAGLTHAVLLGMGGSSLAPEVLRETYGVAPGALGLAVLDNTSPAAVRAIEAAHDPAHTLFIVSSKSGVTIEVASFEKHFFEWVRAAGAGRRGDPASHEAGRPQPPPGARGAPAIGEAGRPQPPPGGPGRAFVAITDPGTPLESLARTRGYRRTFLNPADIGGRYSAISCFGLVPAALIGLDPARLAACALEEIESLRGGGAASACPGIALGAALGELARAGRDKLTLVLGSEIAPLGAWVEQLIAESTGKDGRGIVPVVGEPLGPPAAYGKDRVFVAASVGSLASETEACLEALAGAGHPIVRWTLRDLDAIGAEFARWEIATAAAGAVLGVDPFDEPNVTEAKQATQAVLTRALERGRFPSRTPDAAGRGLEVEAPRALAETLRARLGAADSPAAWLPALLSLARPGDYVALLAYLHRTPARHPRLQRLRLAARAATGCATTLGYGPRFLHSTGQLHKGGPNTGIFLQLTADEGEEIAIPGERYGFGMLRRAQAAGDFEVLERRGRRVLHVHLGADIEHGLDRLLGAVESATRVQA